MTYLAVRCMCQAGSTHITGCRLKPCCNAITSYLLLSCSAEEETKLLDAMCNAAVIQQLRYNCSCVAVPALMVPLQPARFLLPHSCLQSHFRKMVAASAPSEMRPANFTLLSSFPAGS